MLSVFTAARFELLEQQLLLDLMRPDGDPFSAEVVLVPSAAVRRRLALAVADRHGVCAQVEFPFLAQWLWQQIGRVLPEVPDASPYDPALLRWRIEHSLAQGDWSDGHPRLAGWLAHADAGMRFELADRLAGLYDQYLTWRPDWLAAWSAGALRATRADEKVARADELWQAALWRRVQQDLPLAARARVHPAQAFLERLAALPPQGLREAGLPPRLQVFCLPSLPPVYLDLLCGLSHHLDITLHALNPCPAWWFDLASPREHARRVLEGDALHLETGHRWLSAWGRQAQATLGLLFARDEAQVAHDLEEDAQGAPAPAAPHLLARLQQDIRALRDPVPGALAGLGGPDASVQVHACHSLTRELEVLHDCLLGWFARPQAPAPGEVLVVVPDLAAAAPLIAQVFGTAPKGLQIPYAITGLPPVAANPVARALLALLALATGRMPLSQLLAVLQEPVVAERFALDGARHEALSLALREADVRWGLDGAHRAACGQPAQERGTLRDGLERLWLSHVLPAGHREPWQERLPASAVQPETALLDSLYQFLERLDGLRARLATPLRPVQWQAVLEWMLEQFMASSRAWRPARALLAAELQAQCGELLAAAADRALAVDVLVRTLDERLAGGASGGVPTGAVTFAALPSLRALPFRLVCVLGLDDGVFPAPQRPLEFDLIASHPRAGDRTRSDEERNLFFDLLLAARDGLHLSYSGRSARDNGERPPSVLLAELVDTLVAALCAAEAPEEVLAAMRARLVRQHPLQPFDEAYFLAGQATLPHSHRHDLAQALRLRAMAAGAARPLATPGTAPAQDDPGADGAAEGSEEPAPDDATDMAARLAPFFAGPLPLPEPGWRTLELERLVRFLQHPARMLLRDRLGVRLPEREIVWEDDEDFLPVWGAPAALAERLLPLLLAQPDLADLRLRALASAGTDYPPGALGERALQDELGRLRRFAQTVHTLGGGAAPLVREAQLAFELADGRWQLSGALAAPFQGQQLGWDYADRHIRLELAVWVRHLWACAHATPGAELATQWCLRDALLGFRAVARDQARSHLAGLLALYSRGLQAPLRFYPRTALALMEKGESAARLSWYGSSGYRHGEGQDAAWRVALRGESDALAGDFAQVAHDVLAPLIEARR